MKTTYQANSSAMFDVITRSQNVPVYGAHVTLAENTRKRFPPTFKGQACIEVDYADGVTHLLPLNYDNSGSKLETSANAKASASDTLEFIRNTCALDGSDVADVGNGIITV